MSSKKSEPEKLEFSTKTVDCFFDADFLGNDLLPKENTIIITDKNVFEKQSQKFQGWKTVVIEPGEEHKNQATVDKIVAQLIEFEADRQSFIVGVGGGVVTDIAGFVASIYMRGIKFAFVPTSILAMVDASVGGKNGIDVGVYKNQVGVIRHPEFLIYDYSFLETLPEEEWINGFAEIIKHGCIKDKEMFENLSNSSIETFRSSQELTAELVRKNVNIKYKVVASDEQENGERKQLNFGHTIGHAIENVSGLPHGSAVSIGIVAACAISEKINNFSNEETKKVVALLEKYQLPVKFQFDKEKAWQILLHDKKRSAAEISFVVLDSIGKASVKKIPLNELHQIFNNLK